MKVMEESKKKKSAFSKWMFKDDGEENKENTGKNTLNYTYTPENKSPEVKVSPEVKISPSVVTNSDQNKTGQQVDQKLFADLMSRVHSTESPYISLLQQLKALEPFIQDIKMRFEAAYNTLKLANVKKRDIVLAVDTHENVLEGELTKFQNAMDSELKENVGSKREELQNISQEISNKENEIAKLQKEIISLKSQKSSTEQYILTREKKVEVARQAFKLVYDAVKEILYTNKQNITNFIKGD